MFENKKPNGLISISRNYLGRYMEFDVCLANIRSQYSYAINIERGVDIVRNFNKSIHALIRHKLDWIWMLGDDHVFAPDLLDRLLKRDVEVVVPLCLQRSEPILPVLRRDKGNGEMKKVGFDFLPKNPGLVRLPKDIYTGNAGMLVKRAVFERIEFPWLEQGQLTPGRGGFDLYLCKRLHELDIPIFLDTENVLGHMTHVALWPKRHKDGKYGYDFSLPSG